MNEHPSTSQLQQLLAGRLENGVAQAVLAHVDACPSCAELLKRLGEDPEVEHRRLPPQPDPVAPPPESPVPAEHPSAGRVQVSTIDLPAPPPADGRPAPPFPSLPCTFADRYRL